MIRNIFLFTDFGRLKMLGRKACLVFQAKMGQCRNGFFIFMLF